MTQSKPTTFVEQAHKARTNPDEKKAAKPDDPRHPCDTFPEAVKLESEVIKERRQAYDLPHPPKEGLTGLAFSGGGIRAACLAFGFTQGLIRNRLTEKNELVHEKGKTRSVFSLFDYLSTVSGGGYTGSLLSGLATNKAHTPSSNLFDELDPSINTISESSTVPGDSPKERLPLWRVFRYRGRKIGNLPSFLSRHLIYTVIFNIPLASLLVLVTCSLAFLWRHLDDNRITHFLWWASNHNLKESNRPFLIPICLGYAWLLKAIARKQNGAVQTALCLIAYTIVPVLFFGLPFLVVLSVVLLLFWLVHCAYGMQLGKQHPKELRRQAIVPALILLTLIAWVTVFSHPGLNGLSNGTLAAFGFWLFICIEIVFYSSGCTIRNGWAHLALVGITLVSLYYLFPTLAWLRIPWPSADIQFWGPYITLLTLCAVLSWYVAQMNRDESRDNHQQALVITSAIFLTSLLVGSAVWLATPNMNTSSIARQDSVLSQGYMNYIWPFITALLLPLIRPQALFRSGEKSAPPTRKWIFNIVSSAFLVGVPFLLVYFFAQHNLSGIAASPGRSWKRLDVHNESLLEFLRVFGVNGNYADEMARNDDGQANSPKCERIYPFNNNVVALPYVHSTDPLASFLTKDTRKEFVVRSWPAEHRMYALHEQLVEEFQASLATSGFWKSLIGHKTRSLESQLNRNLRYYSSLRTVDASPVESARSDIAKQALELLDLHPSDLDETKAVSNAQLGKESLLLQRIRGTLGLRACQKTRVDIRRATLLFHAAYPELLTPFGFVRRDIVIENDQNLRLLIIGIAMVSFVASYRTVNLNLTSMQNFYRRQLEDAFLTGFEPTPSESLELRNVNTCKVGFPYPLIHGVVTLCDNHKEPVTWLECFTFSPLHCGSISLGYAKNATMAQPVTLAEAMSISGAAVTPFQTEGNYLLLATMTVMNFRLGQWLPRPDQANKNINPTMKGARRSFVDDNCLWIRKDTSECKMIFVADGGYYENLGVIALMNRSCKLIVGLDAGADPDGDCENLLNLLRLAKEGGIHMELNQPLTELAIDNDFLHEKIKGWQRSSNSFSGASVGMPTGSFDSILPWSVLENDYGEVTTSKLGSSHQKKDTDRQESQSDSDRNRQSDKRWKQLSASHFLFFDITYENKQQGLFVYVRSSMTGDEPPHLMLALRSTKPFPNHPTSEQLFDPHLVETYRELGLHLADRLAVVFAELFKEYKGSVHQLFCGDATAQQTQTQLLETIHLCSESWSCRRVQ